MLVSRCRNWCSHLDHTFVASAWWCRACDPQLGFDIYNSFFFQIILCTLNIFNNISCLVQTMPTDRSQIRRRRPWNQNWFMWKKLEPLFFLCWIIIGVQRFGDFCFIVHVRAVSQISTIGVEKSMLSKISVNNLHSLVSSYLRYHNKTHKKIIDDRMWTGVVQTVSTFSTFSKLSILPIT